MFGGRGDEESDRKGRRGRRRGGRGRRGALLERSEEEGGGEVGEELRKLWGGGAGRRGLPSWPLFPALSLSSCSGLGEGQWGPSRGILSVQLTDSGVPVGAHPRGDLCRDQRLGFLKLAHAIPDVPRASPKHSAHFPIFRPRVQGQLLSTHYSDQKFSTNKAKQAKPDVLPCPQPLVPEGLREAVAHLPIQAQARPAVPREDMGGAQEAQRTCSQTGGCHGAPGRAARGGGSQGAMESRAVPPPPPARVGAAWDP